MSTVQSRCECQALLTATLDEKFVPTGGTAKFHGATEAAPASAMLGAASRFDVGWLCPFCGRNTLRSFDKNVVASSAA